MRIEAPISVGELIDKITILEIKSKHLKGSSQAGNVENELGLLRQIMQRAGLDAAKLQPLTEELRAVNAALWTIEDEIRACDAAGDFGPRFTELARSVYRTNDRRSQIKRLINISCSSEIIEEKHYTDF